MEVETVTQPIEPALIPKKTIPWTWWVVGILGVASIAFGIYFVWTNRVPMVSPIGSTETTPTPTPDPTAPRNILLLGYGGGKHEGGALTDSMIVAHVIPKEKRVVLISLPRDLWVPIPVLPGAGTLSAKLNLAFALGNDDTQYLDRLPIYQGSLGGGRLVKDTVSDVTGLTIHHFVAVSFAGFIKLVDTVGGVLVDVPFSFTDDQYPIEGKETDPCGISEEDIKARTATMSGFLLEKEFSCRFEKLEFAKGKVQMDGMTALKFVRSRHSNVNGGDFGRSQRQMAFVKALKDKVFSVYGLTKALPIAKTALDMVSTDVTLGDITQAIDHWGDMGSFTISSTSLTEDNILIASNSANGQYILVPKTGNDDWDSVHTFVTDAVSASPSGAVGK